MVVSPLTTKRTARIGAVVLASCVGAGAILAASPAHADAPVPTYGGVVGIQKIDAQHGAPLSGATLRVCAPASASPHDMTGGDFATQRDRYQKIADQASLAAYQADLAEIIADATDRLARAEAALLDDAALARWEGLIAAHTAATTAAAPYNDAITTANAARQRLADEIIALQEEAGASVPAELIAEHAAAQEAQAAAIAASEPFNDAVTAAFDAKFGADEAIAAHSTAARDAELARASIEGAQTSLDNAASTWDSSRYDTFAEMARRMQSALDSQGNLTPESVGDLNCFTQTTGDDGTIFVPISTSGYYTVAELTAPEGYQRFEGTAKVIIQATGSYNADADKFSHSYSQTSDTAALTPGGDVALSGTGESGGVALDARLTNEKIVEEAPAPAPASQPELPRTGGDTSALVGFGALGTLLAAAGAAMTFRRRTAE